MGLVNVLRFTCANGCCLNWASARRLPGPPAMGPMQHPQTSARRPRPHRMVHAQLGAHRKPLSSVTLEGLAVGAASQTSLHDSMTCP